MSRRWILPAVLIVLLFAASLINVQPGTVGVLRGAGGGRSFLLEPGLHFRVPFFYQLMVFPSGLFRLTFERDFLSREGSGVRVSIRFEGLLARNTLLEFAQRAGGRNGPTVVEDDLTALLTRWAADHSAEEIPVEPRELKDSFLGAAKVNGFQIRSLTIRRLSAGAAPAARSVLKEWESP